MPTLLNYTDKINLRFMLHPDHTEASIENLLRTAAGLSCQIAEPYIVINNVPVADIDFYIHLVNVHFLPKK